MQPPRVGNDVVDLGDARTATAHLRPRFVARVCSQAERARVEVAARPRVLLWSLFAAKEAAFKAVSKRQPDIVFAHGRFEVAEDLRSVRYLDSTLSLRVRQLGACVHAVALLGGVTTVVHTVQQVTTETNLSEAVRALARGRLAAALSCPEAALAIDRPALPGSWTGRGPPRLLRDGELVGGDISLSHDGRFVAFAAITPAAPSRAKHARIADDLAAEVAASGATARTG